MSEKYIYIYNNLINYQEIKKELYKVNFNKQDHFSDRLIFFSNSFLLFFLKVYQK